MDDDKCLRLEAEMAAIERIVRDPIARRELLWLRAHEKDDSETARDLERTDPALRARMRDVLDRFDASDIWRDRDRRDWFGREWDRRYQAHTGDLSVVVCGCVRCRACRNA